eukprot:TRINITY_DN47436_c0_g1_i1.p1 TRINITY_DN47436_c0_g1~~TRINITY_DN47436_c0_g1_i1.p1  ORF type:complete len:783 (+),score=171.38 TRINITY_DN47436_c0_g1_i1:54-2402(+)
MAPHDTPPSEGCAAERDRHSEAAPVQEHLSTFKECSTLPSACADGRHGSKASKASRPSSRLTDSDGDDLEVQTVPEPHVPDAPASGGNPGDNAARLRGAALASRKVGSMELIPPPLPLHAPAPDWRGELHAMHARHEAELSRCVERWLSGGARPSVNGRRVSESPRPPSRSPRERQRGSEAIPIPAGEPMRLMSNGSAAGMSDVQSKQRSSLMKMNRNSDPLGLRSMQKEATMIQQTMNERRGSTVSNFAGRSSSARLRRLDTPDTSFGPRPSYAVRRRQTMGEKWGELFKDQKKRARQKKSINLEDIEGDTRVGQTRFFIASYTKSRSYEIGNALLIFLNALFIAGEADYNGREAQKHGELPMTSPLGFLIANQIFCAIFTLDLILRICVEASNWITSHERYWNLFDTMVVAHMLFETVTQSITDLRSLNTDSGGLSMLRLLRLMRVVRVARMIKVVRFFRELRVLFFSIIEALRSLVWSVMLMFFLFLFSGVCLNHGVLDYLQKRDGFRSEESAELRRYFGTLQRTVMTLYQSISGGVDWSEPYNQLDLKGLGGETFFFLFFITFSIFALLNVVAAVFVEHTMQRSQKDRDFVMEAELESKREIIEKLISVFEEIDEDGNGYVSMEVFEEKVKDKQILTYFSALGLDIETARTLFVLLDYDETGIVSVQDFVLGCIRLKGSARALDMAIMKFEVARILHGVKRMLEILYERVDEVAEEVHEGNSPSQQLQDSADSADPLVSARRNTGQTKRDAELKGLVQSHTNLMFPGALPECRSTITS